MKQNAKIFFKYFSAVILGLATAVLLWCVIFIFTTFPNGFEVKDFDTSLAYIKSTMPRIFVVESGSMEPAIMTGSLILTLPQQDYLVGDVISFRQNSSVVTHRVHSKNINSNGIVEYTTKGDANEEPDNAPTTYDKILGKNILVIPKLGEASSYAKHPVGFILMVIVPATIIVYEELKSIAKHTWEGFNKIKKRKRKEDGDNAADKGYMLPKVGIIVPVIGSFFIIAAVSGSYFSDIEAAIGNILQAGEYESTSAEGSLVINEVLTSASCFAGQTEAQWIELYNGTDSPINPQGYEITDGVGAPVALVNAGNLTIQPGGLLLLAHNDSIWGTTPNSCWNDNDIQTGNFGGQFDFGVGTLHLIDPDENIIDTVVWGDPPLDPATDQSIERDPDGKDTAFGTNFNSDDFVVRITPQPGL